MSHEAAGRPWRALPVVLLFALVPSIASDPVSLSARADDAEPPLKQEVPAAPTGALGDVRLEAEQFRNTGPGNWELAGAVTILGGGARMQADRMTIRDSRYVVAEGNVLVEWSGNRIAGARMTYDLAAGTGVIENAIGEVEPEFYFTAERAEKVGKDRVKLKNATVTTCTQPVPYWSFSISSARIRLNHYAHLLNLRLRAKKVPIIYLPYMIWPVKRERAAGLLFPTTGTTRDRGQVFTLPLFVPMGRSADLTLFGEYYTKAGWGGGGEIVVLPNRAGMASLSGFYIQDRVFGAGRWRATYRQVQSFLNGFRLVADVNQVSDFAYFTDFERELRIASTPTILARVEMTRNGSWTSVNVRELRREQLFRRFQVGASIVEETSVQQTLPEIEWRGRSRRLGRSPFYLSFESSLASIQQQGTFLADYRRADLFPSLSAPVSPAPWLDVNTTLTYRVTRYTQHDADPSPATVSVSGEGVTRGVGSLGVEIVGPKLFRFYQTGAGDEPRRYKHVLEPRVLYSYGQKYARANDILRFDEVDLTPSSNQVTYGLRTRLFAQRPRAKPTPPPGEGEKVLMPEPETGEVREASPSGTAGTPAQEEAKPAYREPVEIASLEVRQSRTFDRLFPLSQADLDLDITTPPSTSLWSPVELIGRLNPNANLSFDLRSRFHILYDTISDVSLSGMVHDHFARLGLSLVHRPQLGVAPKTTQLRLGSGLNVLHGKLRLDMDGAYIPTAERRSGEAKIPDQRWRVEYYTQCCGFITEYLARDFAALTRREFRFSVDLRGIGRILDQHYGTER